MHPNKKEYVTSYHYNYLGQCTKITNPYGLSTEQSFDEFGRIIEIKYPTISNENDEKVKPVIKKQYDIAGFPISLIDQKNQETKIEYNIRGQPIKIEYPDGTSEKMIYRVDGQLIEKVDKNQTRTLYTRDPLGRIVEEAQYQNKKKLRCTTYEYNSFHLTKKIDAEGGITSYAYDKLGRLKKITQDNRTQENFYDSIGRLKEVKEFFGDNPTDYRSTLTEYDRLDRVKKEILQDSFGKMFHFFSYEYDERGNQILVKNGENQTITEYDAHKNPIKITDALNKTIHITYDTEFINDLKQKVLQIITTDPLGYQTFDTYDAANRLVTTERKNPLGKKVAFQKNLYDVLGNRCTILNENIENGNQINTSISYNCDNQIASIIEAVDTPEQKTTKFLYSLGQKIVTIKPDGISLHYSYDSLGRLKTFDSSDKTISYSYHYNKLDQVIKVVDEINKHTTNRTYDSLSQLIQEDLANGLSISYAYDRSGRIKEVHLPDQTSIQYYHDAAHLKEIHRIIDKNSVYSQHYCDYNLSGEVIRSKLPGENGETVYEYDALLRCTKVTSKSFKQEIPQNGFDPAGNLLNFIKDAISYSFTYDDLFHLNSESGFQNHTYRFDSLSNRIEKDQEILACNVLNQVIKNGDENIEYDLNGNLIRRNGIELTYDSLDRLIKINKNGSITTYQYDPFDRRISKKQENREELYLYQDLEEIGSWVNGEFKELRISSNNPHNPIIAIELNRVPFILLQDLTGNTACLLNQQGEIV